MPGLQSFRWKLFLLISICLQIAIGKAYSENSKFNSTQINWIKNQGQQNAEVLFYCNTVTGSAFLTRSNSLVYSIFKKDHTLFSLEEFFLNAKPMHAQPLRQTPAMINYFLGQDQSKWQQNIPTFESISLGEIWSGIQVELNSYENNVEKVFKLAPGANPRNITMQFPNAENLNIIKRNGHLLIHSKHGNLEFTKPIAWQIIDGKRSYVKVSYSIKALNTYGFILHAYNKNQEVIIDPIIASTFLGGREKDLTKSIKLDSDGNVFVSGITFSSDFPIKQDAIGVFRNGFADIFISKFSADLSTLLSSTFIGGSYYEAVWDLLIDKSNNVFITGYSQSSDYPVKIGTIGQTYQGYGDIFISKLNNDLTDLTTSTFIGGDSFDIARHIILDPFNNIVLCGETTSSNYPVTRNSYDSVLNKTGSIFITKINSDFTEIISSTLFEGNKSLVATSILYDKNGSFILGGYTTSDSLPVTPGAFDSKLNGDYDNFIARFNADLSEIDAFTYIGGSANEGWCQLALSSTGNIVYASYTNSADFPTLPGAYNQLYLGQYDIAISILDPSLKKLLASTFVGGKQIETATSLILDTLDHIFVSGLTHSPDFPVFNESISNSLIGKADAYFVKLDKNLTHIFASGIIGGTENEVSWNANLGPNDLLFPGYSDIALAGPNKLYMAGLTLSSDFPITKNAYQKLQKGEHDCFVTLMSFNHCVVLTPDTITLCKDESGMITARREGYTYSWSNGNSVPAFTINAESGGWLICEINSADTFWIDSQFVLVKPQHDTYFNIIDTAFCSGNSLILKSSSTSARNYLWNTGENSISIWLAKTGKFWVVSDDSAFCLYVDTFLVDMQEPAPLNLNSNLALCEHTLLNLQHPQYIQYNWNTGETTSSIKIISSGLYIVTATNGICTVMDSANINMLKAPEFHLPEDTIVCFDELASIILDAGKWESYLWIPTGERSRKIEVNAANYYAVFVTDSSHCEAIDTILVEEECHYGIYVPNAISLNDDNLNDVFFVRGNNILEFELKIYNRSGGLVFQTTDKDVGWDGTYKNQICMLGAYFYELSYRLKHDDGWRKKIGTITLL